MLQRATNRCPSGGFTLIEVTFFIMALGMFTISGIKFYAFYRDNEHKRITAENLASAQTALNSYFQRNRYFPCPAPRNAPLDSVNDHGDRFGAGVDCTAFDASNAATVRAVGRAGKQVRIGALPVRDLGLPDHASMDGWGNRLVYAVTEGYAKPAAPVATLDQGAIYIQDSQGHDVTFSPGTVIFTVMAPGSDQRGVWNAQGQQPVACDTGTLAGKNCAGSAIFAATTLTSDQFTSTVAFRAGPPAITPVVPVNGGCGSVMATVVSDPTNPPPPLTDPSYAPTLCGSGTPSAVATTGPGTWQWTCNGSGGGSSPTCSLSIPGGNGTCGPANGSTIATAPTANLCSIGTASAVSGTGPWTWICTGYFGGSNASCSANKTVIVVNGSCGASNGVASATTPAGLCTAGSATAVTTADTNWNWSCGGLNGGTTAGCSAPKIIDATCGPAANVSSLLAPTSGFCGSGTYGGSVGVLWGYWLWGCGGANGGTSVWCTAPPVIDGACGSLNGTIAGAAPSGAGLCSAGTATAVAGTGPWTWTCNGSGGGANSPTCSASRAVCTATPFNGDLVILLDGTGSISAADWTEAKTFVKNLVANLNMTANSTVGLIEFASKGGAITNLPSQWTAAYAGTLSTYTALLRARLNDPHYLKTMISTLVPGRDQIMNPAASPIAPYRSVVYDAVVYQSPLYNRTTLGNLNTMVDGLAPSAGMTNIYGGILAATDMLRMNFTGNPNKVLLLLTDGRQTVSLQNGNDPATVASQPMNGLHYVAAARAAQALGYRVVTVGIKDTTYNYNPWDLEYAVTTQKGKNFFETSSGWSTISGVQAAVSNGLCSPTTTGWKKVSISGTSASNSACGIRYDGKALCWGNNTKGQLGIGSKIDSARPVQVVNTNPNTSAFWTDISVGGGGGGFACGLMSDGTAWCWGDNASNQLGCYAKASTGHTANCPDNDNYYTVPQQVMAPFSTQSNGDPSSTRSGFDVVDSDNSWTAIAAGYGVGKGYACGLTISGHAWCWGHNKVGQLGDTTLVARKYPSLVLAQAGGVCGGTDLSYYIDNDYTGMPGSQHGPWNTIVTGGYGGASGDNPIVTAGILRYGEARVWGNSWGVANDTCPETLDFVAPSTYPLGPFRDVRAGAAEDALATSNPGTATTTLCGVLKDGSGYCWGLGNAGQLGNNMQGLTQGASAVPRQVTTPPGETSTSWSSISPGNSYYASTCGITVDGKAWCWGSNNQGQFGNGGIYGADATLYTTPQAATLGGIAAWGYSPSNWREKIVGGGASGASGQTTCGITRDDQLWCWGSNSDGQVGNGTIHIDYTTPQFIWWSSIGLP